MADRTPCHACGAPVPHVREGFVDLCDKHFSEWLEYHLDCITRFAFAMQPASWGAIKRAEMKTNSTDTSEDCDV